MPFVQDSRSFNIRLRAAVENLLYAHVPVNSNFTQTSSLAHRIEENIHRSTPTASSSNRAVKSAVLLHFDLASTVGWSMISTLFSLCVIGVISDIEDDSAYFYHPKNTVAVCASSWLLDWRAVSSRNWKCIQVFKNVSFLPL